MPSLVVLTGASGSGKTTLARTIQARTLSNCEVFFFDAVGVPSSEEMRAFGDSHQPGGAWQRATTLLWVERIESALRGGRSVLFEGQMRIAFIHEALALHEIREAHILLIDCDDATRASRLHLDRSQPELVNADMMNWSRYLREEAMRTGCDILDTGIVPFEKCCNCIVRLLTGSAG